MATATPRWANSSAVARPSPVAPPVTIATRPWSVSASSCGWGRSCAAGAPMGAASSGATTQEEVGAKRSNLCSKLNIGKARRSFQLLPRRSDAVVASSYDRLPVTPQVKTKQRQTAYDDTPVRKPPRRRLHLPRCAVREGERGCPHHDQSAAALQRLLDRRPR